MKKINSFLTAMVGTAMVLTSCSQSEIAAVDPDAQPATENIPSEVTIKLGGKTATLSTRAAVMSTTTLPGTMGVWCLAKDRQSINSAPQIINWFSQAEESRTCCLMKNVQSTLVNNIVAWDETYFYPVSQFYRYEFYANFPYTTNVQTNVATSTATAQYTIDGVTDLMWGRATSDDEYAWSAKYFRANGENSKLPDLTMQHMLTRLTFTAEPGLTFDTGAPSYEEAHKMSVVSLEIVKAKKNVTLTIAKYSDVQHNTVDVNNRLNLTDDETANFILRGANGQPFPEVQVPAVPEDRVQLGESLMLFPEASYQLRIVLRDANGTLHETEVPLIVNETFKRGVSYNINIVVHGPQTIEARGHIVEWEEADGPTVDL